MTKKPVAAIAALTIVTAIGAPSGQAAPVACLKYGVARMFAQEQALGTSQPAYWVWRHHHRVWVRPHHHP